MTQSPHHHFHHSPTANSTNGEASLKYNTDYTTKNKVESIKSILCFCYKTLAAERMFIGKLVNCLLLSIETATTTLPYKCRRSLQSHEKELIISEPFMTCQKLWRHRIGLVFDAIRM
jgi:hypothetical protein